MRLHRLELAALGPFPGREVVDFDALGSDGLFLLHGDTGAGKTTLLDAVAFALFGRVPGARNEARRFRCDYADPEVTTRVELELTIQGHRLRMIRSPEYDRPKRRGMGTTKQPAKASLTWVGEVPSGHAPDGLTRIDEVGRTVERLLGMSAEQFFQVVLLPQGEFARFLRADTTEREQLLEKLFGTDRFADVERWFREHRRERRAQLDVRRQAVRELVARVAQAGGEEPPEDGGTDREWLSSLRKRVAETVTAAEERAGVAVGARDQADRALAEARTLAERLRRLRAAHATLENWQRAQPDRSRWVAERDTARRALAVIPLHGTVTRLAAEVDRVAGRESAAASKVLELGYPETDAEIDVLRSEAERLREQAGGLAALADEAERQRTDQARIDELESTEDDTTGMIARTKDELAAAREEQETARTRLDLANEAAARLDGLRAREADLRAQTDAMARLPRAETELKAAEDALRSAIDEHHAATELLLDMRRRRLDSMAAELAANLKPRRACPVCGSRAHPKPGQPLLDFADQADEDKAQQTEKDAQAKRGAAERARQQAEHRVQTLVEAAGEGETDELAEALDGTRQELLVSTELTGRRDRLATTKSTVEDRVEWLTAKLAERERRLASVRAELHTLRERVTARVARLDEARGDYPDVLAKRAGLTSLAAALSTLAELRLRGRELRDRLAEQCAEAEAVATRHGFSTVDDALASVRDEDQLTELERRITDLDHARAAAEATLAEPELVGLPDGIEADVDTAARQAAESRKAADIAVAESHAASETRRRMGELELRLRAVWDQLEPVEAEFAELDALTDVVNGQGQNTRRMSLRSYVLAARLEEVAVAATSRLGRMSQGRYAFVHSDAAGSRGTRGGLGLDVLDDYSGKVRPAKTLSGGESFLASLALALGLADVVAAETGGALLDTLFVDEGFGTLDANTLDEVMDTLDDLRAGGRVVGLVSHVEELRQRIPTRLRVSKSRTGSTLDMAVG